MNDYKFQIVMLGALVIGMMLFSCTGPLDLYDEVEKVVEEANRETDKNYLTIATSGGGEVYPSGTIEIGQGESKTIEATAANECTFVEWVVASGNAKLKDSQKSVTTVVLRDKQAEIRAVFSSSITVNSSTGGSTSPSGEITDIIIGKEVEISASPDDGYYFGGWSVTSGKPEIQNAGVRNTKITLSDGPATVRADFTTITYLLTLSSDGHGSVSPSSPTQIAPGASQDILAEPDEGYHFETWSVVQGSATIDTASSETTRVTLNDGDAEVRAFFERNSYQLTVESADENMGTVSPSGTESKQYGDHVSISATPKAGYEFMEWNFSSQNYSLVSGTNSSDTIEIIIQDKLVVSAVFAPKQLSLSFEDNNRCTPDPGANEVINIYHGSTEMINVIETDSFYYFDRWEKVGGDGTVEFGDAERADTTVTVRNADVTIAPIGNYGVKVEVSSFGSYDEYEQTEEVYIDDNGSLLITFGQIEISATQSYMLNGMTYYFDQWEVTSGTGTFEDAESRNTTLTVLGGGSTLGVLRVVAHYEVPLFF